MNEKIVACFEDEFKEVQQQYRLACFLTNETNANCQQGINSFRDEWEKLLEQTGNCLQELQSLVQQWKDFRSISVKVEKSERRTIFDKMDLINRCMFETLATIDSHHQKMIRLKQCIEELAYP
jgi:uncharacterized protein Yka (UPF0111/DUF47 family)